MQTNGKGPLNTIKVGPLKPKLDKKKAALKKPENGGKLWDHVKIMRNNGNKLVDLRRDRRDGDPIKPAYFRTSARNYISFDLLSGESKTGVPFSMPKIFFTNYYNCKKKLAAGEDPSSANDVQFSAWEAPQIIEALKKMAELNPEVDFNLE